MGGMPMPSSILGSNDVSSLSLNPNSQSSFLASKPVSTKEKMKTVTPVKVQGDSLRTCSFNDSVQRVDIMMNTEGRPLNADVELWQGPDNAPQKMTVYLEDGSARPFCATIECPGSSNSISIRNTGHMEFPLTAGVSVDMIQSSRSPASILDETSSSRIVQGGAVYTSPFAPAVQSVQIMLETDGRPMNVRVELLQGPNNVKQVMEIYSEDGKTRPFYGIIETQGSGNVVRIVNTSTVEFPLNAALEPYVVDESMTEGMSGDMNWS
mmetsp:Transcript_2419/g.3216  ORF Transcript_2419/g.3216 Transcript_2419/m.3216 type:complete len:266 (+) Transcript_2419:389-1186(+)